MSDEIRRILDEQARRQALMDPYSDIRKYLGPDDSVTKVLGVDDLSARLLQGHQERDRLLAGLLSPGAPPSSIGPWLAADGVDKAIEQIKRQHLATPLEEARRLGLLDETADIRRSMATAQEAVHAYEQLFRLPAESEIERLARESVEKTSLTHILFGRERTLEEAMAGMHAPWLKETQVQSSAQAFAELIGIGRGIERNQPFDLAFTKALRPALGDWRETLVQEHLELADPRLRLAFYRQRGFDSGLTDFTSTAFHEGLRIAGLFNARLESPALAPRAPRAEPPPEGGSAETEDDAALRAFSSLRTFEISVRQFIVERLQAAFGAKWTKRGLPKDVVENCELKKARAEAVGADELPLIDYADFSDYIKIIDRADNWRDIFQAVFARKEDVKESFQRLGPVRISTMHSRLVLQEDELLLAVETRRVLKAIHAAPAQRSLV